MKAHERAAAARAQGNAVEARYWQRIADLVDQAPPLSPAQQDKLRVLLRPDVSPAPPKVAAA